MARKYNVANRIGVKRGPYKEWGFGDILLPKKGKLSEEEYIKSFIETNKERLEKEYNKIANSGHEEARKAFKQKYVDVSSYAKSRISIYRDFNKTIKQTLKQVTMAEFGEELARFRNNLIEGMKTSGIYNDFLKAIDENLDLNKINYTGDGTYQYITNEGLVFTILTTTSPLRYEFVKELV